MSHEVVLRILCPYHYDKHSKMWTHERKVFWPLLDTINLVLVFVLLSTKTFISCFPTCSGAHMFELQLLWKAKKVNIDKWCKKGKEKTGEKM